MTCVISGSAATKTIVMKTQMLLQLVGAATMVVAAPQFDSNNVQPYSFAYGVNAGDGDQKEHKQSLSSSGVTEGEYRWLQPSGLFKVTRYTADGLSGYRATVSDEPGEEIGNYYFNSLNEGGPAQVGSPVSQQSISNFQNRGSSNTQNQAFNIRPTFQNQGFSSGQSFQSQGISGQSTLGQSFGSSQAFQNQNTISISQSQPTVIDGGIIDGGIIDGGVVGGSSTGFGSSFNQFGSNSNTFTTGSTSFSGNTFNSAGNRFGSGFSTGILGGDNVAVILASDRRRITG